ASASLAPIGRDLGLWHVTPSPFDQLIQLIKAGVHERHFDGCLFWLQLCPLTRRPLSKLPLQPADLGFKLQLIPRDLVEGAQKRRPEALEDEPLIAGVDVPDGGSAWFVVRFRRGLDAVSVPPVRIPGSRIDRQQMIATCARLLSDQSREK